MIEMSNWSLANTAKQFFHRNMLLPLALFLFQAIFIILLGTLVEYESRSTPSSIQELLNSTDQRYPLGVIVQIETLLGTRGSYSFFQDVHVMAFVGFGFLMTFLRRYGFSSIGFNLLLASFAIQWSTITCGLFTLIQQAQDSISPLRIQVTIQSLVGSDFAAIAVLITMGVIMGRASPLQMIIIAFFEIILYSCNEAINTYVLNAADVGGSLTIHAFGAYFGLAVSFILYRKAAIDNPKKSSVYHSDIFAMIGTLFLWVFWPSFNGALATGVGQYRAVVNTYFAMTASVFSTFIFAMIIQPKRLYTMVQAQQATLAGGVAVGAVANMILQPWGSVLLGFLAGMLTTFGIQFLTPLMSKWLRIQDTRGVHNLHGMPAILAGIASAVAAGVAEDTSDALHKVNYGDSLYQVFPARAPSDMTSLTSTQMILNIGKGDGRHAGTQAGYQLALVVITLLVAIVGGLLTGLIARIPIFLPPSDKDLFDDAPYWLLPDGAETSVEEEEQQQQEERPRGGDIPLQIIPTPAQPEKEDITVERSDKEYILRNEDAGDEEEEGQREVEEEPAKKPQRSGEEGYHVEVQVH